MLLTLDPTPTTTLALGPSWLAPEYFIGLGLVALLVVVFVETGLLIGFFLPGDSLLFTAGLLVAEGTFDIPLWVLLVTVPLAAIAGDQVGYTIGRQAGPRVFNRPDSWLFQQEFVDKAYGYFERYGPRTIVLARFVPSVRTFAPVVAGVSRMSYRTFLTYNVVGGVLWGAGVSALGYVLGQVAFVRSNVAIISLAIVGLSVLPILFELLRARREYRSGPPADSTRDLRQDETT